MITCGDVYCTTSFTGPLSSPLLSFPARPLSIILNPTKILGRPNRPAKRERLLNSRIASALMEVVIASSSVGDAGIGCWDLHTGAEQLRLRSCSSTPRGLTSIGQRFVASSQLRDPSATSGSVFYWSWDRVSFSFLEVYIFFSFGFGFRLVLSVPLICLIIFLIE